MTPITQYSMTAPINCRIYRNINCRYPRDNAYFMSEGDRKCINTKMNAYLLNVENNQFWRESFATGKKEDEEMLSYPRGWLIRWL